MVRQIHHSTLRKDELVARIHEHLRGGGAGDSDKENGGGATADDSGAPDAANKPAAGGAAAPVSKRLLTQFLVYVSTAQSRMPVCSVRACVSSSVSVSSLFLLLVPCRWQTR